MQLMETDFIKEKRTQIKQKYILHFQLNYMHK